MSCDISMRWFSANKIADLKFENSQYQSINQDQVWEALQAISLLEIRKYMINLELVNYMHADVVSKFLRFYFHVHQLTGGPRSHGNHMVLYNVQNYVRQSLHAKQLDQVIKIANDASDAFDWVA